MQSSVLRLLGYSVLCPSATAAVAQSHKPTHHKRVIGICSVGLQQIVEQLVVAGRRKFEPIAYRDVLWAVVGPPGAFKIEDFTFSFSE
jgi:hypothetical protein